MPWKSLSLKYKTQTLADARAGLHGRSPRGISAGRDREPGPRSPAPRPAGRAAFPALGTSRNAALGACSRAWLPPSSRAQLPTLTAARLPAAPRAPRPAHLTPRPAPKQSCSGLRSGWGGVGWGAGAAPPAAPSTSLRRAAVPEPGSPLTVIPGPPTPAFLQAAPPSASIPQEGQGHGPHGAHGSEAQPWIRALGLLCFSQGWDQVSGPAWGTLGTTAGAQRGDAHRAFPPQARELPPLPSYSQRERGSWSAQGPGGRGYW